MATPNSTSIYTNLTDVTPVSRNVNAIGNGNFSRWDVFVRRKWVSFFSSVGKWVRNHPPCIEYV